MASGADIEAWCSKALAYGKTLKKSPVTAEKSALHVLVVDDEPLIRWSVCEVLRESGHEVTEASDGASAVQRLSDGRPFDVVVLDFRLPDSNDLRLLETIRRLTPGSAVIMMTAFGTPEMVAGALALGASRVLSKPFDVHDLAALVAEVSRAH
jgi:DNA-binding NtrC family response regulator